MEQTLLMWIFANPSGIFAVTNWGEKRCFKVTALSKTICRSELLKGHCNA
uniref:Uncharacterized protein n=1 Tax=Setaria italica TaxID=4555 RepID=K3ZZ22_SETIT